MSRSRMPGMGLAAVAFGLGACAATTPELPGDNASTYAELRSHYRSNAWEQEGDCRAPYLDGILETRTVEETDDQVVLEVSYAYRDLIGDENESDILGVGGSDRCQGVEQRTFTLEKLGEERYEVVAMSGRKRGEWGPTLFE